MPHPFETRDSTQEDVLDPCPSCGLDGSRLGNGNVRCINGMCRVIRYRSSTEEAVV